jgi:hypothetical protein
VESRLPEEAVSYGLGAMERKASERLGHELGKQGSLPHPTVRGAPCACSRLCSAAAARRTELLPPPTGCLQAEEVKGKEVVPLGNVEEEGGRAGGKEGGKEGGATEAEQLVAAP